MVIEKYIRSEFEKRAKESGCLVIYDPLNKYKSIVDSIKDLEVIDCSNSTILGREEALDKWVKLDNDSEENKGFIIYIQIPHPEKQEDKLKNPYLFFEISGSIFPQGDSDSFLSICHKAFPDKQEAIDQVFASDTNPDFETINNAVISDKGWAILRSLLKVESTSEILTSLLSPSPAQLDVLNSSKTWVKECKQFLESSISLKLLSRGQKWETLKDEIWRFVLFSEFVFDLPEELPKELVNIPKGDFKSRSLIYSICDNLRSNEKHQERYIQMANQISSDLRLEESCQHLKEFGARDTFEFEERTFLDQFSVLLLKNEIDKASKILGERTSSIWAKNTNQRQLLWTLAERALNLKNEIHKAKYLLKEYDKDLNSLFIGYQEKFYKVDKYHREFEQVASDCYDELGPFGNLVNELSKEYYSYVDELQNIFMQHVQLEGWPIDGQLRNSIIFDSVIDPLIKERQKIAFIMVDALRYELAIELKKQIEEKFQVDLSAVCAQIPTATKVGMASLLPNADGKIILKNYNGTIYPEINGKKISNPDERVNYIKSIYGDICHPIWLDDFIYIDKNKIPSSAYVLIIKTKDIDDLGEHIPNEAASLIPKMLQKIFRAINKLGSFGFQKVILATDHGFILQNRFHIGDNIKKPDGNWIEVKSRYLIGKGDTNEFTISFKPEHLGVKTEYENLVFPKKSYSFNKGAIYYHEGISLQECVLPLLNVTLAKIGKEDKPKYTIHLSYRGGKTNEITTRRPMIDIEVVGDQLFEEEFEVQLEAIANDEIIGEPGPSPILNYSTNYLKIKTGETYRTPLKMEEDFEGEFEVRLLNPETQLTYSSIKLKTNYMD